MSQPQRLEKIFTTALAIENPAEREAFLQKSCAGDAKLLGDIQALLQSHDDSTGPLDAPPPGVASVWTEPSSSEYVGAVIGAYKIREQIGEGGFGVVYVAEQEKPVRRKVALKLIKPGMDTKDVIARFEAERQALALMDHPNVAKVLDAGETDRGRPFFVMELVQGVRITDFCDKNRLSTDQRLKLFVDACRAVQHAHQKGIIHRDIKPSNILVTLHDGQPVPKVIDFGVSKALSQQLTEKSIYTAYGQMIGTPEYMSPEQAEMSGLGIDTRSDIYSLGVLLYELLAGSPPFESERLRASGYEGMLRIIRDEEPPRPSTKFSTLGEQATAVAEHRRTDIGKLRQTLRGELDWIVMKALEKDRNRRYETANSFLADVERFLCDEPIEACPPTTSYKIRKFVRRNKGAVIAATALLVAVTLGLTGTSLGLVRAKQEATRALGLQEEATKAQRAERRLNFHHAVDRGLALCDEGHVGSGMLWLAHALVIAPENEAAMKRAIRANLNAWRRELHALRAIYPHAEGTSSVSISPDQKLIVTGTLDGWIQQWDRKTGKPLGKPVRHEKQVHEIPFSSDGSQFLTASYDGSAQLWKTGTGELIRVFRHDSTVYGALFLEDSRIVTSTASGKILLWNPDEGDKPVKEWPLADHAIHDISLGPDGNQIVAAWHDGGVVVWDLKKERFIARFEGHSGRVATADFVGPNKVVSGDTDGNVILWTWTDTEGTAVGTRFGTSYQHNGVVHRLRVSQDGSRILTASFDNDAQLLASQTGAPIAPPFEHFGALQSVALASDGITLTACGDNYAREWQTATGSLLKSFSHEVSSQPAIFTNDVQFVLIKIGGTATVRRALTGEPVGPAFKPTGGILGLALNRDNSLILTAGSSGIVQLWETKTGKPFGDMFKHGAAAWEGVFTRDGKRAMSGGLDGIVQAWNVATGKRDPHPLINLGSNAIRGVALSHDGSQLALAMSTKEVFIVDAMTGQLKHRLIGHQDMVMRAAFSRDGKYLVTGGFDNTARVWDVQTELQVSPVMRLPGPIWYSVAFNSEATTIVTACDDRTARIWDVETGKQIGPSLLHESTLRAAAFAEDDQQLITGTANGTTRIWNVAASPIQLEAQDIKLWLQAATGMELDPLRGELRVLSPETWNSRRDLWNDVQQRTPHFLGSQ